MPRPAIICVDDEAMILDTLREQLRDCLGSKYQIEVAVNGEDALTLFQALVEDKVEIPLIITDQIMPGMQGDQLLTEIHANYPKTLTILLTGQANVDDIGRAVNNANLYRYIAKPWDKVDLAMTVKEALRRYAQDEQLAEKNARLQMLYDEAQREIEARQMAEAALQKAHDELELRVQERTVELVEANGALQQSNVELDAFAHTVAHDLNNPLSVIVGYADHLDYMLSKRRLKRGVDIEMVADIVSKIRSASRKAAEITDSILLLASIHQSKIQTTSLAMNVILEQVQEQLSLTIADSQAEIVLPESWPTSVGYGPWVEAVWVNYMSNALKYGGRPPQLILGATPMGEDMICFWLQDNGPGLSSEDQSRLFTAFTRLDEARAEGHGLGLSIVQRIIDKLGGEVGVESKIGQGSRFYFTLPRETR